MWECSGAPDYESNGECVDPFERLEELLDDFDEFSSGTGEAEEARATSKAKGPLFAAMVQPPLGSLGFNFSQHGPTTRPSRRKDCRESIYAFASALRCGPLRCDSSQEPFVAHRFDIVYRQAFQVP